VGGGVDGTPDWKSRASRSLAVRIEHAVLPSVDALTGVSTGLLEELAVQYPALATRPRLPLPIGVDPQDFEWIAENRRAVAALPPEDGAIHACYVGTVLPLGHEALDALLAAVDRASARQPAVRDRLRLHFIGTSNQPRADGHPSVSTRPGARAIGPRLREMPGRIPYLDALRVLSRASIVLVLGTTEHRYTASKLTPALASGRPVIAIVHRESDVARALAPMADRDPAIALLTYDDHQRAATLVDEMANVLGRWTTALPERRSETRFPAGHTGPEIASMLATLLAGVTARGPRP
jgi:hypothetical protein